MSLTTEMVILVDSNDHQTGVMEKMQAHLEGRLHRAFSVLVFNLEGKWLLHKRASDKYHSGGLWTNACCSHPRPGETIKEAAIRRMEEEMGMKCHPEQAFSFTYRAELEKGLVEHELDYVFVVQTDDLPTPNPLEVEDFAYLSRTELEDQLTSHPERFTAWFRIIFEHVQSNPLLIPGC